MCSLRSPLRLGTRRERGRDGANPGGMERQSILKEIKPEYSLERLMLKLKLQYFGQLM